MCSVELCETDDDSKFLGVVSTCELVASNEVIHAHGGIELITAITESDGYKMLRVAASGDAMVLVAGNGTTSLNVSPGDLLTTSDVRKNYGAAATLYEDGNDWDNGAGVTDIQFLTTSTGIYDYRIYYLGANQFGANRTGILTMDIFDFATGASYATSLYDVTLKQIAYTTSSSTYYWTSSTGATLSQDWKGGYLAKSIYYGSSTVCKVLMACDFSNSVATLEATFSGVDEFVAEDGLTYRTALVPAVFT